MADNWQEVIANSLRESIATKEGVLANWEQVARCGQLLIDCLLGGGTIFFIGNGGSTADAQHLAAELVGRAGGLSSLSATGAAPPTPNIWRPS